MANTQPQNNLHKHTHSLSTSFSSLNHIPEFVLLPPQEEENNDPCLVWIPDVPSTPQLANGTPSATAETPTMVSTSTSSYPTTSKFAYRNNNIASTSSSSKFNFREEEKTKKKNKMPNLLGLENPGGESLTSAINSVMQVLVNLAAIHDELPLTSPSEFVTLFTRSCHSLNVHHTYPSIVAISTDQNNNTDGNEESKAAPPPPSEEAEQGEEEDSVILLIRKIHDHLSAATSASNATDIFVSNSNEHVISILPIYELIMKNIILLTRFGKRFHGTSNNGTSPVNKAGVSVEETFINLEVGHITGDKVELIPLLNNAFGLPSLFFGGKILPTPSTVLPLLQSLPHFLVLIINRSTSQVPSLKGDLESLNSLTLSAPLLIDLSKHLSPNVAKPAIHSHSYKGSPTSYKLHGFITQKDGKYFTYTRRQSGKGWWRCEDENVEGVEGDFEGCIESRGVSLFLYRLQDL